MSLISLIKIYYFISKSDLNVKKKKLFFADNIFFRLDISISPLSHKMDKNNKVI